MLKKYLNKTTFNNYKDFKTNYNIRTPMSFNFAYDVIDEWAKTNPNKVALQWSNNQGQKRQYTFADLSILSDKAANSFEKQGIQKGDTVLLMLRECPEMWISLLGLHKVGAIAVPAPATLKENEIAHRLERGNIKMLVCVDDEEVLHNAHLAAKNIPEFKLASVGEKTQSGFLNFREEINNASPFRRRTLTINSDPMLMYFTSGTTADPKMLTHDFTYPLGHIATASFWHGVDENSKHTTVADSGWAKFTWSKIYGQWLAGATIVAHDMGGKKFDPQELLDTMEENSTTSFCAAPSVYNMLLGANIGNKLRSVKKFMTAGERLPNEIIERWEGATGKTLREGFGQTESAVMIGHFGDYVPVKKGFMGKPVAGYDVDLVDDDNNPVADGKVGSLVVRLDKNHPLGLFRGYHNDPEATKRAFHDNMYFTGDTAIRDSDGYYQFTGRNGDWFKANGGYRISSLKVESTLTKHPAVAECLVRPLPDPEGLRGDVVFAKVVLNKGVEPTDNLKKSLQDYYKETATPHEYPRVVEFVNALERTISGKIKRGQVDEKVI